MRRSAVHARMCAVVQIGLAALVSVFCAKTVSAQPAPYRDAFEKRVSDPADPGALDTFIIEAAKEGQYDQALSTLEEVLLGDPNNLDARLAVARIYYNIGSYDLASAHLDQAELIGGAAEAAALRARIDRALAGIETRLAVSAGVAHDNQHLDGTATTPAQDQAGVRPYTAISAGLVRHLDTASSDSLRFGASARYDRPLADADFDGDLEQSDRYVLHADATYSKGLPDIIDTLRFDISAYGMTADLGGSRIARELGTEAMFSVQPTVETVLRLHGGYGRLGGSSGLYGEHRLRLGVAGEARIAAGVTLGAHVTGYREWGTAPFVFPGGSRNYTGEGMEAGASVTHLLHVFESGRAWIHEAGATYSRERVPDYGAIASSAASMADRESWTVHWNHSVQIATRTDLDFGVSYGQDRITGTVAPSQDSSGESWGVSAGLTFRFN